MDDAGADAPRAPGGKRSHYAPGTPLDIMSGGGSLRSELEAALAQGGASQCCARTDRAGEIRSGDLARNAGRTGRVWPGPLRGAAALDAAGVDRILADAVPADEAWAAIADRLMRAAARGEPADGSWSTTSP